MSGLGALAVDDRGRRARLAPFLLACRDIERVMEALQRAIPVPQHEVAMRRALGRQVLRQRLPLATGRKHVEDGVQNLADIHLAPAAAALGWRDYRLDECPFGVRQIARIAKATVIGSTTVFRLPHAAPHDCDSGATQGITNDSFDSTTFWIGSKVGKDLGHTK